MPGSSGGCGAARSMTRSGRGPHQPPTRTPLRCVASLPGTASNGQVEGGHRRPSRRLPGRRDAGPLDTPSAGSGGRQGDGVTRHQRASRTRGALFCRVHHRPRRLGANGTFSHRISVTPWRPPSPIRVPPSSPRPVKPPRAARRNRERLLGRLRRPAPRPRTRRPAGDSGADSGELQLGLPRAALPDNGTGSNAGDDGREHMAALAGTGALFPSERTSGRGKRRLTGAGEGSPIPSHPPIP
jgi:hypothetical protein